MLIHYGCQTCKALASFCNALLRQSLRKYLRKALRPQGAGTPLLHLLMSSACIHECRGHGMQAAKEKTRTSMFCLHTCTRSWQTSLCRIHCKGQSGEKDQTCMQRSFLSGLILRTLIECLPLCPKNATCQREWTLMDDLLSRFAGIMSYGPSFRTHLQEGLQTQEHRRAFENIPRSFLPWLKVATW
jgi:hypothetical protein